MQAASLAYYFPLNYARNQAVALEAERLGFFSDLSDLLDFGSGMGSALHAYQDVLGVNQLTKRAAIDVSGVALGLGRELANHDSCHYETTVVRDLSTLPTFVQHPEHTLMVASYVLTELSEAPRWWDKLEALCLVEPSTHDDARRLMTYRSELINKGYHVWAPCTHLHACPMMSHSDRDWCHDRIHWQAPEWFLEIEKFLPMKNRTLTFSYLLARKSTAPPASLRTYSRLTGDMLEEKGKTRQSLCRGPEREYLAWFPQRLKAGEIFDLQRGGLVRIKDGLEKRATEVRMKSSQDIEELEFNQSPS